ncbi:hypothetical protein CR513_33307, partial [Mucuna pruriens]
MKGGAKKIRQHPLIKARFCLALCPVLESCRLKLSSPSCAVSCATKPKSFRVSRPSTRCSCGSSLLVREPHVPPSRPLFSVATQPSLKTCYSFWMNARHVFANDVQHLFDSTQKIVSLQQTNHDMVSHVAKAKTATEELKGLLVLHPDYEHVRDQILSSEQIPSMNSLVIRLLRVPIITKDDGIAVENSAMVTSRGRGQSSHGTRGMI